MDEKEKKELRFAMDVQFRHKLYNDPAFKYYHSMGFHDIIQGFGSKEVGFIGVLHLKWKSDTTWISEWHDDATYIVEAWEKIQDNWIFDMEKIQNLFKRKIQEKLYKDYIPIKPKEFLN